MVQSRSLKIAAISLGLLLGACASTNEIGPSEAELARSTGQAAAEEPADNSAQQGSGDTASSGRVRPEDPNVVSSGSAAEPDEPNVVSSEGYSDPFIHWNRHVFAFNDAAYRYALVPLATGYLEVVPEVVQTRVGDFFHNIKSPVYIVNYLAQGEGGQAGNTLLRFAVNSTVGVLGLFDVAEHWLGVERRDTRSARTLQHYGVGQGPYLVLPLIGPSTVRQGGGLVVDAWLNPLAYILDSPESLALRGLDNLQDYAPNAEPYMQLREESEDLYTFVRNLYLQGLERDEEFRRGGFQSAAGRP